MSEPSKKKAKTMDDFVKSPSGSSSNKQTFTEFLQSLAEERRSSGKDICSFKFIKKRVRVLSKAQEVPDRSKGILYWMTRDQRVQDNWSFLFAQKLAIKNEIPLHVCFCLRPKFLDATIRHYLFMLKGLKEVSEECNKLDIEFHLMLGEAEKLVPDFVQNNSLGAVVTDFSPLRVAASWVDKLKDKLPKDVPLCQVDAHNIVPCWVASDKLEYGARTIRNKINSKLDEYLTKFPTVCKHPFKSKLKAESIDWEKAEKTIEVDTSVGEVKWAVPGYTAGMKTLYEFCNSRLKNFATKRNDPTTDSLSNLSPWFHFGQVSVQRCILVVRQFKGKYKESVDAFCEESIVRRELADNFCFYNPKYDSVDGAYDWAKKTLNDHKKDKREYIYTRDELEKSLTHDDLWNSAQIQLVKEGKMHGFLRMYWAKKILEWTTSPEEALSFAIYLNDRFSMDGRDPNGFVGCMWSICGIHDQGWAERAVFGKIRYMNYQGCKRKFKIDAFVARYGGKVHKKK